MVVYYLASMASELMKESTKLSVSPPGDLKEETQRKQTHSGFIYNAGPVSLLCGVCQLGLDAHRVLHLLPDGGVLHGPAAAPLAHVMACNKNFQGENVYKAGRIGFDPCSPQVLDDLPGQVPCQHHGPHLCLLQREGGELRQLRPHQQQNFEPLSSAKGSLIRKWIFSIWFERFFSEGSLSYFSRL